MNTNPTAATTDDLASLVRLWRSRIQPSGVQSPFGSGARRTPGLRREEVAWLAGMSPDYLKRIEQGRARPSAGVLRALSRALQLSKPEFEMACRLAGHAAGLDGMVPQHITPTVRRLLDRLSDEPVAVFDAAWTLLDCNALYVSLSGLSPARAERSVNQVWRFFNDMPKRIRHSNRDEHAASLVADLRDVASRYPADPELADLIAALRATSDEFARLWGQSSVAHHGNERKTFDHPEVGEIELDCDVLSVHGADLRVVVFTVPPNSEAADKLRRLAPISP